MNLKISCSRSTPTQNIISTLPHLLSNPGEVGKMILFDMLNSQLESKTNIKVEENAPERSTCLHTFKNKCNKNTSENRIESLCSFYFYKFVTKKLHHDKPNNSRKNTMNVKPPHYAQQSRFTNCRLPDFGNKHPIYDTQIKGF